MFVVLQFLVIVIDAASQGAAVGGFCLGQVGGLFHVIVSRAMKALLEDWIGIHEFELGLEVT